MIRLSTLCALFGCAALGAMPVSAWAQSTSNFSMVGFDLDLSDSEKFTATLDTIIEDCETFDLDEGRGTEEPGKHIACVHQKANGGQIWIGLREDNDAFEIITTNPAFVGKSRFPATIKARISDEEWEPFEYQLAVTFGDYNIPLVVELADPRQATAIDLDSAPQSVTLDLTAFVFSPQIYASEAGFIDAQAQQDFERQLSPDFFIPTGLFGDKPDARASFASKVIEAELMKTRDGATHWRTLVEVLGGATINVVFDDAELEKPPQVGDLIAGDYWLSARILND